MLIPLREYDIKIRAASTGGKCNYDRTCHNNGAFAIFCKKDDGIVRFLIDPCCDKHVIVAMIDSFIDRE